MADRPEKPDRREPPPGWKARKRTRVRARPPLPDQKMKALFEMLHAGLAREKCDNTLRLVKRWLKEQGLAFEPVEAWLNENGGYCDCEVVLNAEEAWQEARSEGSR